MTLIGLLVFCIVVGLVIWLIGMLPLTPPWNIIVRVLVVIIALIYLLQGFGGGLGLGRL